MSKYPCSIIEDLIPGYIDGVCSDKTNTIIAEHLQECPKCRAKYDAMKGAFPQTEDMADISTDEKEIVKKINDKIKAKNRKTRFTCIAIVCALILVCLLFIIPVKPIPSQDIEIDNYYCELLFEKASVDGNLYVPKDASTALTADNGFTFASYNTAGAWSDNTVFLYPEDKNIGDCSFIKAISEKFPNYIFAIDSSYLNKQSGPFYISCIILYSKYKIAAYSDELIDIYSEIRYSLKDARTTLLGNQSGDSMSLVVRFYPLTPISNIHFYENRMH